MAKSGWKGESRRHSLARKGIKTENKPMRSMGNKDNKEKMEMPKKIYHGTDLISWNEIQEVGFINRPDKKAKYTELGYLYGTTEEGWAEVYAEMRAKDIMDFWNVENLDGVILEIDLTGLPVEYDPTVALDSLTAFRVPLPISPERIKLHKRITVGK